MKHHRLARMLRILWLIQEQRVKWTSAEFARRFKISRKTFYKDLRDLQDAGVTVYWNRGYKVSSPFLAFRENARTAIEALPFAPPRIGI